MRIYRVNKIKDEIVNNLNGILPADPVEIRKGKDSVKYAMKKYL